jgi:hypothetical protein
MTIAKTRFILFAVALATVAGGASAQPYSLAGSDTLEVVMKDSIKRLDGTLTYGATVTMPGWGKNVIYQGGGSGTAEKAVAANKQSIAAMSRNLNASAIGVVPSVCTDTTGLFSTKTTCTPVTPPAVDPCIALVGAGSTCSAQATYCSGAGTICAVDADCATGQTCTGTVATAKFTANNYLNVVGVDAAVLVQYAPIRIADLKRSNFVSTYGDLIDTTNKMVPNLWGKCSLTTTKRCAKNPDSGTVSDSTGADAACPAGETCVYDAAFLGTTYNNAFEVMISGVDGSGTTLACSHPARLKALADFKKAQGNKQLFHFYRRDDNSGTTDTFKDKAGVGNFCNGSAQGVLSTQRYCAIPAVPANPNATPPTPAIPVQIFNARCATATAAADCAAFPGATCPLQVFGTQVPEVVGGATSGLVSWNVANQDLDPVRFPCPDQKPNTSQTNCTNVWTAQYCTAADNNDALGLACDPTLSYNGGPLTRGPSPDGGVTPGAPLNGCPCTQGFVVALSEGDNSVSLFDVTRTIGSRVAGDTGGSMGYAGREAISFGASAAAPSIVYSPLNDTNVRNDDYVLARRLFLAQAPNNADSTALNPYESAAGTTGKLAQERLLANFMTAPVGGATVGSSGACNIQDIVKKAGFLGCTQNCKDTPKTPNICAKTFPPAPTTFPARLVPGVGYLGGPWWDFQGAVNLDSTARNCAVSSPIGSPATGAWVTATASGGTCASGNGTRPAGYACSTNRECASNSCLDNTQGLGILICQ